MSPTVFAVLSWLAIGASAPPADTVFMLGSRSLDLTGDGRAEQLQLVAAGPSVDSLSITFTILDRFEVLYATEVPVVELDGLRESFFAEDRFMSVEKFLATYRGADVPAAIARDRGKPSDQEGAAAIWREIQDRKLPIFTFTLGRDNRTAIAWSEADRGFVLVYQAYPR